MDTIKKKEDVLKALEKTLGVVTTACKQVNIARSTYYEWYAGDEEFRKKVDELQEVAIDFGESALHQRMNEGSDSAIIFFLKTKGKKRGYVERSEFDIRGKAPDFSDLTTDEIVKLLGEDEQGEEENT